MKQIIRAELETIAEEKYRLFSSKLIPNINNVLGVRLPALRKIAKRLIENDQKEYLKISDFTYFEEVMLQGMMIGLLSADWKDKLIYVSEFIPKIDNWSVCDSFCNGLKIKKKEKIEVWNFLQPYFYSTHAYEIRFAVVMLLFHFVDDSYIDLALPIFDNVKHDDYYVKMAVAWAISIYYREFPDKSMVYLLNNKLNDWTYNKALQKITESLTIDAETKEVIRSMKRKRVN